MSDEPTDGIRRDIEAAWEAFKRRNAKFSRPSDHQPLQAGAAATRKGFSLSLDDAAFWLGIAVFSDGLYLVAEHPIWGTVLIVSGILLLAWSNRGHMPRPSLRLAALYFAMAATIGVVGYDIYERHFLVSALASASQPEKQPAPKSPRSKQTINDLLNESGTILDIVKNRGASLDREWRELTGINPERICIDLSLKDLQGRINTLASEMQTAEQGIGTVLDQNGIDRVELLHPVSGTSAPGVYPRQFDSAASILQQYGNAIGRLGEHPTCENVVAADFPDAITILDRGLVTFGQWVGDAQNRLTQYRDALRTELRNAP